MKLSTAARNALVSAYGILLNNGSISFYSGAAPANVGDALTGTLLGTCAMSATAYQLPANGSAVANAIGQDVDVDADGTVGYAVAFNSASEQVSFLSVGLTGSGADIELNILDFVQGGTITITGGSVTMPVGSV